MHWSKLPEAHEKLVKPFIHPALDENNFLSYFWRTFIYPGKREMFDGSELKLPPYGIEDEPWLFTQSETYSNPVNNKND